MCIAILNTADKLTRETLNNSWNNNPEGAGLLWAESGKVQTYKTYKRKELVKTYEHLRDRIKTPIVLHFRIATSGHEKYTNLHPFEVNSNLAFVHNGILTGLGNQQHSDTYQLCDKLKTLHPEFIHSSVILELLEKYIGASKLIFLTGDNTPYIVNEKSGMWDGSNWFSNDSHKYDLDFYYFGNEKRSKTVCTPTTQNAKTKTTTKRDVERQQTLEYLRGYYTGVTAETLEKLEDLMEVDAAASSFLWEIEDAARMHYCYDLYELSDKIERGQDRARSYYAEDYEWSEYKYN